MENYFHPYRYQEAQECVVVFDSNTVVDPRAVVIEPFHTLVADCAVSRSSCTDYFAFWAQVNWVDVMQQLEERGICQRSQVSWVFARCCQERGEDHQGGESRNH